jgi:tetratricopeptide (TPR) repeat protein
MKALDATRLFVAMLGCCWWVSAGSAAEITVRETEGGQTKERRGEITEETTREVVLTDSTGKEERIPVFRIDGIKYDGQPAELASARSFGQQSRYDDAIQAMTQILDQIDAKSDPYLDAAIRFEIFVLRTKKGLRAPEDLAAALEWYQGQQELLSTSRHYYPSLEWLGRLQLARREFTAADDAFTKLGSVDWPGYRERSQRYLAQSTLEQGKPEEAARLFADITRSAGQGEAVAWEKGLAQTGQVQSLVAGGQAEEAERLCRAALANELFADRSEALAPLRNALGDALLLLGRKKEAALEGYLWVHILYPKEEAEHARALFQLTTLLGEIGYPQYGEQMAQTLRGKYPATEWARKLQPPSS